MTYEEMAQALRLAGWRVEPPLTQENCQHLLKIGSGSIGSDGSGSMDETCRACGKRWHAHWSGNKTTAPTLTMWQ